MPHLLALRQQPDASRFNSADLNTAHTGAYSGERTPRTMFCSQKQKLIRTRNPHYFLAGQNAFHTLQKKKKKKSHLTLPGFICLQNA